MKPNTAPQPVEPSSQPARGASWLKDIDLAMLERDIENGMATARDREYAYRWNAMSIEERSEEMAMIDGYAGAE